MKPIAKSLIMLIALFTMSNAIAKENATLATSITFKDAGSGIVEMIYDGSMQEKLTVEIFGKKSRPLHREVMKYQEKFKKPFNLKNLPYGSYTIRVSTKSEEIEHKINYKAPVYPGKVKVTVHPKKDGAYKYQVLGPQAKDLTLLIYDDHDREIHREDINTKENFGKVYSFQEIRSKTLEFILVNKGEVINNQKVRLQ